MQTGCIWFCDPFLVTKSSIRTMAWVNFNSPMVHRFAAAVGVEQCQMVPYLSFRYAEVCSNSL
jgi:hypothetical protein